MTEPGSPVPTELAAGSYFFDDLSAGQWWRTGRIVVTETHVVQFAGLSGDFFDVHMDEGFAREQGFPGRIAHGLLGLALVDGLKNRTAVRLEAVASLGWTWRFLAPILIGDTIGAKLTVGALRPTSDGRRGIATISIAVSNQDTVAVQSGETMLLMRRRP